MSMESMTKKTGNRQILEENNFHHPDIDIEHFKTFPGALKFLQFVLTILVLDLTKPPVMLFIGHVALLLTTGWILNYIFNVQKRFSINASWINLELFSTGWITISYFITGFVVIINSPNGSNLAAGICGLIISVLGGIETVILSLKYRELKMNAVKRTIPIAVSVTAPEPRF